MKEYYVYIMASKKNGTIYTGVTSDIKKRVYQHKNNVFKSFSAKYNVHLLVYFIKSSDIKVAINEEKRIKGLTRKKKLAIIEDNNKNWNDLSEGWYNIFLDSSLRSE